MGKKFDCCGICGSYVVELLTFSEFPFAGRFTKEAREQPEYIADLSLGICNKCNHVQLITMKEYSEYRQILFFLDKTPAFIMKKFQNKPPKNSDTNGENLRLH